MSPTRTVPLSEDWEAEWVPDEGGGGDLRICVTLANGKRLEVHGRYHQSEPADDDTLKRWASEQLGRLAAGWRPREGR